MWNEASSWRNWVLASIDTPAAADGPPLPADAVVADSETAAMLALAAWGSGGVRNPDTATQEGTQ